MAVVSEPDPIFLLKSSIPILAMLDIFRVIKMYFFVTGEASMISGFRITNLRSIADSEFINIKKLNILVGRNSSGKSTVLRFLPLLRQSVEQATKGPILWYGRLVDFGSFNNAARDGDVSRGVKFEFSVMMPRKAVLRRQLSTSNRSDLYYARRSGLKVNIEITLGRSSKDRVGNIRRALLTIGTDKIDLKMSENGRVESLTVMGEEVSLGDKYDWWFDSGKVIPSIYLIKLQEYDDGDGKHHEFWEIDPDPFGSEVVSSLAAIAHGRTSHERLVSIAKRLSYANPEQFRQMISELSTISDDLRSRFDQLGSGSHALISLRRYVLLSKLSDLTKAVDEELADFAGSVRYIEPLRANAERYYRQQDLAVEDIDSRGANTAMFLGSLDEREMSDLQEWMMNAFGFKVVVESDTGHVQIKITDETHGPRNIADLGFGYSQILPIVLQIWRSSRPDRARVRVSTMLAMEQPELHLHPDYQARLADILVSSVRTDGSPLRAFIETHSDHFINRLGVLVSEGQIDADDVQILVVQEDEAGASKVLPVSFDGQGLLGSNWPIGFFTPERH